MVGAFSCGCFSIKKIVEKQTAVKRIRKKLGYVSILKPIVESITGS